MDLEAAKFHFETALEMMGKLREEQQRQEGAGAEVSVYFRYFEYLQRLHSVV